MKREIVVVTNLFWRHDFPTTLRSIQYCGVEYVHLDLLESLSSLSENSLFKN